MSGYSGTPLWKKLGVKSGGVLCMVNAPKNFELELGGMPNDVKVARKLIQNANVVVLFAESTEVIKNHFLHCKNSVATTGGIWVCWYKRSSGIKTDLTEAFVRDYGLQCGLVDNKICAVNEQWSGLRFVFRLVDRS